MFPNEHRATSDHNRLVVYPVMMPFTAVLGLQPSEGGAADPRTVRLVLELLERIAGRR